MLNTGQVLQNRYQINSVLGQGAAGAVYQAYDERLGIDCVVKEITMLPDTGPYTTTTLAQLWQEASTLVRLAHPHLPRVTNYFQQDDGFYLIMDLVSGQRLDGLIGAGLPEPQVLHYADQLLDALEYLHGQGTAHGDVKPANVIVDPGDHLWLVDLGPLTPAVTPSPYTAPERTRGTADALCDIYSTGATLYHALTGRPPMSAGRRASGAPLTPPRRINPAVPAGIDRSVLKAMDLNPGARFQSAAEFLTALRGEETTIVIPTTASPIPPPTGPFSDETSTTPRQAVAAAQDEAQPAPAPAPPSAPRHMPRAQPQAQPQQPQHTQHRRFRVPPGLIAVAVAVALCVAAAFFAETVLPNLTGRGAAPPGAVASPVPPTPPAGTTAAPSQTAAGAPAAGGAAPTDTPAPGTSTAPSNTPSAGPTCQHGQAAITSPAPNAVLHGTVPVVGTATCDGFAYYKFEFVDPRCGSSGLCFVAGQFTQPVPSGLLMNWDTTRTWDGQPLPNSTYVLRLTVVGQDNSPLPQHPEVTITINN